MLHAGFALISMLLAAMSLAQATPTPDGDPEIPPVVWELAKMAEGARDPVQIAEPERYTIQFLPDGELAIGADCNRATGTFTAQDGALDITMGISTLVLCPPDSQVDPFLALLESASEYAFDDDGFLVLSSEDGSLWLRSALLGVSWEWQDFQGSDDSIVAPENPEDYTITFLPEGKLAIQADCNRAMGTYAADGPTLDFTIGGTTRAMCPPGSLMERYLRDLGDVSSHVFRDGNLYLALPVDAGIMEFVARYQEPPAATPEAG